MEGPCNLLIIRHGLSEHNLQSLRNRNNIKSPKLDKHTTDYKLVDEGKKQAKKCGEYIKENISEYFDVYISSEYTRTLETAYFLGLDNANWKTDFFLRERDKGNAYGKKDIVKKNDFYWAPPGGESIANLCQRVDKFLDYLNKKCCGLNVIVVTHGTIMQAFKIRLENLGYGGFENIKNKKIRNCEILWYTQRNPLTQVYTGEKWVKRIDPNNHERDTEWKLIEQNKMLNNDEIEERVKKIKRVLNNDKNDLKLIYE